MSLSYQERKAKGQRKRAEHLRRLNHAEDLSRMFWGIALGFGFMFVMGIVANTNTPLEFMALIVFAFVIYFSVFFSQYVMFRAEQSRYPKNRRRTLRSEVAEDWQRFRDKKS
jgi:amino acid permease